MWVAATLILALNIANMHKDAVPDTNQNFQQELRSLWSLSIAQVANHRPLFAMQKGCLLEKCNHFLSKWHCYSLCQGKLPILSQCAMDVAGGQ